MTLSLRASGAAVLGLLLASCSVLRIAPDPDPEWKPGRTQRYISPDPPRLVVEVDVIEGSWVTDKGLALWRLRLMEMLPKREIEIRRDEIIPAEEWKGLSSLGAVTARHRSVRESSEQTALYVLVADQYKGMRGYGWPPADDRPLSREHPEIILFSTALRPIAWLSRPAQEAAVLTHETGHLLGLVDIADHSRDAHCTHGECLMHEGITPQSALALGWGALVGQLPSRYCHACLRDLYGPERLEPAQKADLERALGTVPP